MNAAPVAGALLDARYRVGSPIATGGMSTVYRGVDTRLDRPVAIKIMDARFAGDPAFRMRFEREARSAARIDHPSVIDVHDQGVDHDRLFLVMELVDGSTLRDVLRARGALGVPAAFAVMEQVLCGLAEAHRLGMVHRDVKPENVLISETREVKVADFGLAVAAAQAGASHAGTIMGTVAYLSPEQVATGAADPRSDVYAAGILLYELLTGAPPYTGETAISVAYRHVTSDVPAPSEIAGDVPPELDAFVQRATRRDPAARPADAAAMLAELRQLAAVLEVPRVPVPPPPPRPIEEQTTLPHVAPSAHPSAPPNGTRMLDRHSHPSIPPGHLRVRRRSRRIFAVWVALVLVLATGIGMTAWWLGSGRWTAVPSLTGVQRDAAERLLSVADLVPAARLVYADGVPEGVVTATEPGSATQLLRGSTVTLVVSRGLPTVPAIAPGTALDDAQAAIRAAQFTPVQAGSEYSSSVPAGAVVRTNPAAGTPLSPGSRVTLVVSRGEQRTQQVRVPFLIGKRFDDAERILDDLGLQAEERPGLGRDNGRVVDQSNGPGSLVDPGTTIVLETL